MGGLEGWGGSDSAWLLSAPLLKVATFTTFSGLVENPSVGKKLKSEHLSKMQKSEEPGI